MKQFDVVRNPDAESGRFAPFLVVLSSHLIDLDLIVLAPLLRGKQIAGAGIIVPVVFDGEPYSVSVAELVGVPSRKLRQATGSRAEYEDEIRRGIDRLFSGF